MMRILLHLWRTVHPGIRSFIVICVALIILGPFVALPPEDHFASKHVVLNAVRELEFNLAFLEGLRKLRTANWDTEFTVSYIDPTSKVSDVPLANGCAQVFVQLAEIPSKGTAKLTPGGAGLISLNRSEFTSDTIGHEFLHIRKNHPRFSLFWGTITYAVFDVFPFHDIEFWGRWLTGRALGY